MEDQLSGEGAGKRNYLIVGDRNFQRGGESRHFEPEDLLEQESDCRGFCGFRCSRRMREVRFFTRLLLNGRSSAFWKEQTIQGKIADPGPGVLGLPGHWIIWNGICSVKKRASGPGISVCGSEALKVLAGAWCREWILISRRIHDRFLEVSAW